MSTKFTKRQHTVPSFYLRNFLAKGESTLWVYDKKGEEPKRQSPKDSAVITDFYTFETPDGEKENLEKEFGRLEDMAKPIFDLWQRPGEIVKPEEKEIIAEFLAFQQTRTPRAMRAVQELGLLTFLHEMPEVTKDPQKVKELWKKQVEDKGRADDLSLEQFQAFLEDPQKDFEIQLNDQYALGMALQTTKHLVPSLLDRYWCLCVAPGNAFFLTSDTPMSVIEPDRNRAWSWGGVARGNAYVLFPISSEICLLLSYKHTQKRWSPNEKFVSRVNLTTISMAERFIYSSRDTKRIRQLVSKSSMPRSMTQVDYERLKQSTKRKEDSHISEREKREDPREGKRSYA